MFDGLDDRGEQELIRLIPFVSERIYQTDEMLLTPAQNSGTAHSHCGGIGKPQSRNRNHRHPGYWGFRSGFSSRTRPVMQVGDYQLVNARALEPTRVLYIPFRELVRAYDNSSQLRAATQRAVESRGVDHHIAIHSTFSESATRDMIYQPSIA